jgi:hypothetical protein
LSTTNWIWNPATKTMGAHATDIGECGIATLGESNPTRSAQVYDQCMRSRGNRTKEELDADIGICKNGALQKFMGRPKQAIYDYAMCMESRGWGPLVALSDKKTDDILKSEAYQEALEQDRQHRAEVQRQIDQENASQSNDSGGNAVGTFLNDVTRDVLEGIGAIRSAPHYAPSPPTYGGYGCRPPAQACR